jgi:hypothetical protein
MSRTTLEIKRYAGLSDSDKEGIKSSYRWAECLDYRTDPTKLTLLPRTVKESGSVVLGLPMVGERYSTNAYVYDNAGYLYKRTSAGVWSNEHQVGDSAGNGLKYYGEDDYLYYPSNKVIGRYGPMASTPTWVDDWLGSEGGVPLNTNSLDLEASSSQYGSIADNAALSIIADISLETCIKPESLPADGAEMALMAKWDESGTLRSYWFGLGTVSAFLGSGGDGALTISADTTQAPTDSAAAGTIATKALTATNASFAVGQKVLIIQMRGTNAGTKQINEIDAYTAGTITLVDALNANYNSTGDNKAQVIVLPQYTNVTVNSGKTWSAKAWNGTVGGVLAFLATGTVSIAGAVNLSGKGFSQMAAATDGAGLTGYQGEGIAGASDTKSSAPNGNGGGGGEGYAVGSSAGGGGGGNGTTGTNGNNGSGGKVGGTGGNIASTSDLTTICMGGEGGEGGQRLFHGGGGGDGGAIGYIMCNTFTLTGSINLNGAVGGDSGNNDSAGGGGGAGGSLLIQGDVITLGTGLITASGGAGGAGYGGGANGGAGGSGVIHIDYITSYTGTTTPTFSYIQDPSLSTSSGYCLKLKISNDGTAYESYYRTVSIAAGDWHRVGVGWDASESTAFFYLDGVFQGTATGAMTAIHNNASAFYIGTSKGAAAVEKFYDGLIDDSRVFNDLRTAGEMLTYKDRELAGSEANLIAYYEFDAAATDTAGANDLTLSGSPSYSTDVPFSSPTSRNDLDKSLDTTGNTYTVPVAIVESSANKQEFVPAKDPQKSIEVLIAAIGSGNWTLTVHDALNRTIASKTVTAANLNVGDFEFVFASVWRPVLGATYHFHLTSTVANGTVTTTSVSDLNTVDYHSYYQFLVEDAYHPEERILEKLAIGNERYLATWNGVTYNPHTLTLPSGYRIRCLGLWRGYLAVGTTRGANITDEDQGMIFLWDGRSTTYNDYIPVPQGGVNAILSGDPLYFVAGYSGDLLSYAGGGVRQVKRIPKMVSGDTLEVYPGSMTTWQSLIHVGVAGPCSSSAVKRGVYSYGTISPRIEESMSFDYKTSLGIMADTALKVGMVFPIGSHLLIGWQYGVSFGVDVVKPTNAPFASGRYESLITDVNKIIAPKQANFMRGYFKKLVSGDTVRLEYKIDRDDNWTEGTAESTANAKESRLQLPTKGNRFNELEMAVNLTTTNTASPNFYGFGLELDDLASEKRT